MMMGSALGIFLVLSRDLGGNESGSSFPFSLSLCSSSGDCKSRRSVPEREDWGRHGDYRKHTHKNRIFFCLICVCVCLCVCTHRCEDLRARSAVCDSRSGGSGVAQLLCGGNDGVEVVYILHTHTPTHTLHTGITGLSTCHMITRAWHQYECVSDAGVFTPHTFTLTDFSRFVRGHPIWSYNRTVTPTHTHFISPLSHYICMNLISRGVAIPVTSLNKWRGNVSARDHLRKLASSGKVNDHVTMTRCCHGNTSTSRYILTNHGS